MLADFDMSRFIVCTAAGLSSATNRVFNTYDKEEGVVHTDKGDKKQVIEQKLIVSYSIKYRNFLRHTSAAGRLRNVSGS